MRLSDLLRKPLYDFWEDEAKREYESRGMDDDYSYPLYSFIHWYKVAMENRLHQAEAWSDEE